jgi:hypothetical protein
MTFEVHGPFHPPALAARALALAQGSTSTSTRPVSTS